MILVVEPHAHEFGGNINVWHVLLISQLTLLGGKQLKEINDHRLSIWDRLTHGFRSAPTCRYVLRSRPVGKVFELTSANSRGSMLSGKQRLPLPSSIG